MKNTVIIAGIVAWLEMGNISPARFRFWAHFSTWRNSYIPTPRTSKKRREYDRRRVVVLQAVSHTAPPAPSVLPAAG